MIDTRDLVWFCTKHCRSSSHNNARQLFSFFKTWLRFTIIREITLRCAADANVECLPVLFMRSAGQENPSMLGGSFKLLIRSLRLGILYKPATPDD